MKTLKDFNYQNKRVLVRCDFNVPLSERGEILDDFRIRETIPTIEYLINKWAKVILISHIGRPEGKVNKKYSLKPISQRLEKSLNRKVHPVKSAKGGTAKPQFNRVKFLDDCIGEKVKKEIEKMEPEDVVLLENLRFYKEEEENGEDFAKELAKMGDIFINDAFATCHRAHASIVGVPKYLPSGAGILLEREIKSLKKIIEKPEFPLVAIFGGREANFEVIEKISELAKFILIGWLIKKEIEERGMVLKYPEKIIFPIDGIDERGENFDIGKKTIKVFKEKISQAKTIFWSGPLGKIEEKRFKKGTEEIARTIIESGAFSVVGGGKTVEFINKIGLSEKFNHLSTGGGAMLEFLSGEKLPGIEALR